MKIKLSLHRVLTGATHAVFFVLFLSSCHSGSPLPPSRSSAGAEIHGGDPAILKQYDAFYIPEIEVYSIEGDILRRVSDADVEDLARSFRSKIIRKLGNRYTMFPQPARNVANIKIALSDVSSTYTFAQLYPGMIIPNAMRGGATIDATVTDSVTGQEVLTYRDTKQGARQGFFSGLGKWDGVNKAFDEWAMQLGGAVTK